MEWFGWAAFMILIFYSAYPQKVKKLESKVKKLEREQGGANCMSKIINTLIGKSCKIKAQDALTHVGAPDMQCMVLDADDEWIKLTYTDKKNVVKTKILRIDAIDNIELMNE